MIDEASLRAALRLVIDPELDCNLVDLGLIYGIAIDGVNVNARNDRGMRCASSSRRCTATCPRYSAS